jgi:hypothetical protein
LRVSTHLQHKLKFPHPAPLQTIFTYPPPLVPNLCRPRRGQVTLVYETGAGEEVRFTRAINPTGEDTYASQYKLDGRNCTWDAYTQRLESYGILVKARNFLVFQGDIENVAQMSPKDLTNLFEHISGSGALKVEYEEQEERLREAESETAMIHAKKKGISAEKKLKKEQKAEAERHMGLVKELVRCCCCCCCVLLLCIMSVPFDIRTCCIIYSLLFFCVFLLTMDGAGGDEDTALSVASLPHRARHGGGGERRGDAPTSPGCR